MTVIHVAGVLLVAAAVDYSQRISRQVAPAM
jgi:hypothetical protein